MYGKLIKILKQCNNEKDFYKTFKRLVREYKLELYQGRYIMTQLGRI